MNCDVIDKRNVTCHEQCTNILRDYCREKFSDSNDILGEQEVAAEQQTDKTCFEKGVLKVVKKKSIIIYYFYH